VEDTLTKSRTDAKARPVLVVHPPVLVAMTPEERERAFAVMKALFLSYLRDQRALSAGLDKSCAIEPSSLHHEDE
jgi:hypothetical protein